MTDKKLIFHSNLRKTCILLNVFENLGKSCQFFALDLSLSELERTLSSIPEYRHVAAVGLHGNEHSLVRVFSVV